MKPKSKEEILLEYSYDHTQYGIMYTEQDVLKAMEEYRSQWVSVKRCPNCNVPEMAHGSECGYQNAKLLVLPGSRHIVSWDGRDIAMTNERDWEWLVKQFNSMIIPSNPT